jgi:hypothetical protein
MTITQSGAPQCSALRDAACRRCWKLPTHNVSCRFSSFSTRFYDALDEQIMWLAAQLDRHALDAADQCWVEIQARKFALARPPRGHSFRSLDHRTGELMQRKYALSCHER